MWNSSSQCKICYKVLEKSTSDVRENETDEDRKNLLSLCSEYLFNELCDWQTISHKDPLPFCAECSAVIEKIKVLDRKFKCEKEDISDLSEQFTVKVLRLRNKRQRDEVYPKIVGGVAIKTEKGFDVEQKITCKICRGVYNEQPLGSNDSLNLTMVAKVIQICKKYLFSEIFDDGCLDVNVVARLNLLPFCFDCCIVIHEICQKNDSTESISAEIEKLVNRFALKILNHRKNGKLVDKPESVVIKFALSPTPDHPSQNVIPAVEENESDEDCMIVDVIPAGVERNALNSLCRKLKGNKQVSPGEIFIRQAFPPKTPAKIPFNKDVRHQVAGGLSFVDATNRNFEASPSPPILEPMVNASNESMELNSSSLETGTVEGEEEPKFSEETPGPSTNNIDSNRQQPGGKYVCINCGAGFMDSFGWFSHKNSCFKGSNVFESETGGQCFTDSLAFNDHANSHETGDSKKVNPSLAGKAKKGRGNWNHLDYEKHRDILLAENRRIHNQIKSYKCPRCSRHFSRRNHLTNHLRGNSCLGANFRQMSLQKVLCQKRVRTSKKNSIIRMVKQSKGRSYSCRMCPLTFTHSIIFSKHVQTHYDIATIRCGLCRMVFNNIRSKAAHVYRIHSGKFAKKGKKNRDDRSPGPNTRETRHLQRVDEYEIPTDSDQSQEDNPDEEFEERQSYNDAADPEYYPNRVKNAKAKRVFTNYTCSICGMKFTRLMHLRPHLQTHYDEAPFRCTTCKMVVTDKRSLNRHMIGVHAEYYNW